MGTLVIVAGWIALAAALCGSAYTLLSLLTLKELRRPAPPNLALFPAVSLLKPLCGAEPGLEDNLEGFFRQDYPAAVQIVFGVQSPADAAIGIVERLRAKYPGASVALAVSTREKGVNPKISNLTGMLPLAKHNVLVLSDSDIGVPAEYLRKVVTALEAPGVGAVTCYYRGQAADSPPRGNFWPELSAMDIDYRFLPNAVFAVVAKIASPCFGSTIALHGGVLREIGGFAAFSHRIADDYEIGRAVQRRGRRLAYAPVLLTHNCTERGLFELYRHELRWARTIRSIDGAGHAGSAVTHILPLGFLGALLLGFSAASLGALGLVLAVRLAQTRVIDRVLQRKGFSLLLVPIRDMLSFAVFVASFFVAKVDWRGARYPMDLGGPVDLGGPGAGG